MGVCQLHTFKVQADYIWTILQKPQSWIRTDVDADIKWNRGSDELLGLEEALEVPHLPRAHHDEDAGLREGPPQHPLVRALARRAEPLLAVLKGSRSEIDLEDFCAARNLALQHYCTVQKDYKDYN